jgi:hypothetical protein
MKEEFDITFLSYISKIHDPVIDFEFKRIYWDEFNSAQDLINKIIPDKLVFMSNWESSTVVCLNIIAKLNNVKTYFLQHGVMYDFNFYYELEKIKKNTHLADNQTNTLSYRIFPYRFLLSSLLIRHPIILLKIILYLIHNKESMQMAVKKHFRELFQTDFYLVFTQFSGSLFLEREEINPNKLLICGNYYFDDYFASINNLEKGYYLLIDQAYNSNNMYDFGIDEKLLFSFYNKLLNFAKSKNKKLYVKLHPFSYNDPFYQELDDEIIILKDANLIELIQYSDGCFGTLSTALLPAMILKPCCIFKIFDNIVFQTFVKSGLAQIIDFKNFEYSDINLDAIPKDTDKIYDFIEKFFYKTDGKSIERLIGFLK